MHSTLLVGPPGVGKTTCACTAAGKKLILDMDNKVHKMQNIKDKVASGEVKQWAPSSKLFEGKLGTFVKGATSPMAKLTQERAKGYQELADMIDTLNAKDCTYEGVHYDNIILDSYTTMEEHLKRLLMTANGVVTISQPLWGTVLTNYENLNNALLNLNANLIIICHENPVKDDLTGKITCVPLISGQMKNKIGKEFEEVYYLQKKISSGTAKYEMLTVGDSMRACRTSLDLEAVIEPNLAKIRRG